MGGQLLTWNRIIEVLLVTRRKIATLILISYPVYWAYGSIHDAIVPYWRIIAGSALSLPLQMPDAKYQLLK